MKNDSSNSSAPLLTRLLTGVFTISVLSLTACGTVESAAKEDCTSIGWTLGSAGYEDCFRARVRERDLDYSRPSDLIPKPGLL